MATLKPEIIQSRTWILFLKCSKLPHGSSLSTLGDAQPPRAMADTEIPPLSPDDAKLIRNERAKLTAMWVNGVAVASVAVGGISPSVAIFSGTASALTASALLVGWSLLAGILHLVARRLLGALRA